MEPREAFFLGYLTSYVGIPFRGLDILNAANKHSDDALAARIAAQVDAFRSKNAETVDSVLRVEAILGKHGLARPPRPQTLESWKQWADAASQTAGGATAPDSAAAAALTTGGFFGDLLAAVQLQSIAKSILDDHPGNAVLVEQLAENGKHAARAVDRIDAVLRNPALPAAAKAPLEQSVAAYRRAPDAFATLKAELNKHVPELVNAF